MSSPEFTSTPVPAVRDNAFRDALARFASGITVVTTIDDGGRQYGFTASSFCSVSLRPPLVLVCLARHARSYPAFAICDRFAVSMLQHDQAEIARRFASSDPRKLDGDRMTRTPHGMPAVQDALATIECLPRGDHTAGDHMILLGEVVWARTRAGSPLLYYQGDLHRWPAPAEPYPKGHGGAGRQQANGQSEGRR